MMKINANADKQGKKMSMLRKFMGQHTVTFILILLLAGLGLAGWPLGAQDAEAAVAFRGSSTATKASGTGLTSLSIAMPTGTVQNDILIAVITNGTGITITAPTGWTSVGATNSTATIRQTVFWKRAASGEAGPYSFTQGTTTTAMTGGISSFSGCVTTGTPYVAGTAGTGASTTLSAVGVVPSVANSMIVYIGSQGAAATYSALAGTDPATWTYHVNYNANTRAALIASGIRVAATTSGTRTATASITGNWVARQLSLTPATIVSATTLTVGDATTGVTSNTAATAYPPSGTTAYTLDGFTLAVNQGTATVNSLMVTLSNLASDGVATVTLTSAATGGTTYGTVNSPLSSTVTFTNPALPALTTTAATYYIRITPKSHANMPARPGSAYAVTGTVTAVATSADATILTKNYNDSTSATLYIDNESPASISITASQGPQHSLLTWTNPADADFSNVLLVRKTASDVTFVPVDGGSYSGTQSDGSVVRYSGFGGGKGSVTTYDDLQLADGQHYYYKIWARDSRGNYSATPGAVDKIPGAMCLRYNPVVVIQPLAQNIVTDGGRIKYMVSVTNKDVGCPAEAFTIAINKDTNANDYLASSFSEIATVQTTTLSLVSEGSVNVKLWIKAKSGLAVMGDTALINLTNVSVTSANHVATASTNDAVTTITRRVPIMHNSENLKHRDANDPQKRIASTKWGATGTVTEAGANTLTDISMSWTDNLFINMYVLITGGTGSGQSKMITANTSQKLTVDSNWNPVPDTSSTYSFGSGWGVPGGQYGEFTCGTCHEPHAANIKGVKSVITAPTGSFPAGNPVVFSSTKVDMQNNMPDGMGDDTGGHSTSNKICEVCHSRNMYHNADSSKNKLELGQPVLVHNNDSDCITCHTHDVAFNALASPCDTCHGYPPPALAVSDKNPNGTGSQSVGMHDFHNATAAAGRPIVCDTCHAQAVGTGFNDNGKISIGFNIYPGKGSDGKGFKGGMYTGQPTAKYDVSESTTMVSVDANSYGTGTVIYLDPPSNTIIDEINTTMMRCDNVYCHGGTMQPNGGRPWSYWNEPNATVCLTCHGATADDPPTKGEHQVHAGATGNNMPCSDCHFGFKPQTMPSNLPTHANGAVEFAFDTAQSYIGPNAVYTPDPNGLDKDVQSKTGSNGVTWSLTMPSIPDINGAYNKTYGTCSNVGYCHPGVSPKWGSGSLPSSCNSCHADQGAGHITSSGTPPNNVHQYTAPHSAKHTQTYLIACESCHSKFNKDGSKVTQHAKGFVTTDLQAAEVSFTDKTGTIQYDGSGNTFSYKDLETSPYDAGILTPVYAAGQASAGADPVDAAFSWTAGSCSTVWCHSNASPLNGSLGDVFQQPTWSSATLGCSGCHSATTDAPRSWSPTHDKHTRGSQDATMYSYTCNDCHNTVVSGNTTITAPLQHADGVKTVVFSSASGGGTATGAGSMPGGASCSATYCHSNGITVATGGTPAGTVNWGDNGIILCNGCHGGASDTSGRPEYTNGSLKANDHNGASVNKHESMGCQYCHNTVTTTGTSIANVSLHVNKSYNVSSPTGTNYAFNYSYSSTGGTCSTSYCHSTVQANGGVGAGVSETPKWGEEGWGTCATKCHKSGANLTTGNHQKHITDLSIDCAGCHDGGTGDVMHANFVVDMAAGVGYSQGNAAPQTNGYGTCATYCHSAAQGADGISLPAYAAQAWGGGPVTSGTGDTCTNTCHSTKATLASGSHGVHVGQSAGNIDCAVCHIGAGAGTSMHVDKLIQFNLSGNYQGSTFGGVITTGPVTGAYTKGGSFAPQTGFGTCAVSCHSGYTPNWAGGGSGLNCGSCHLYAPATIAGATALSVEGKGAHAKHIDHLLTLTGLTLNAAGDTWGDAKFQAICGVCHDVSQNVLHQDGSRTIKMPASYQFGSSAPAYNGVPGTSSGVNPKTCSNVSCHYTTTPVWSSY